METPILPPQISLAKYTALKTVLGKEDPCHGMTLEDEYDEEEEMELEPERRYIVLLPKQPFFRHSDVL